jgi:hypothetical protein
VNNKIKENKEKPRASLHFPKAGIQPNGLADVGVDEQVTVVLKGKMTGIQTSEWDEGRHIELVLTGCELHGKQVKVTLDDALQQSERKR